MIRPPVTLSREMKILLTALGLVALLGGWLVWNNQKQGQAVVTPPVETGAAQQRQTTPAPAAPGNPQTPATPGAEVVPVEPTTPKAGSASAAGVPGLDSSLTVSDGKTEVATVPPFPVTDPNGSTPDPTVLAPIPSGINPNQPLGSLNGHNPFRPIKIDGVADLASAPANTVTSQPNSSQALNPVTIRQPTSTQAQINSALNPSSGGALPIPQIPTTSVAPASSSGQPTALNRPASGGALPIPIILGASSTAGGPTAHSAGVTRSGTTGKGVNGADVSGTHTSVTPISGAAPGTTISVSSDKGSSGAASRRTDGVDTLAPIAPPVTGLRIPDGNFANAAQANTDQLGGGQSKGGVQNITAIKGSAGSNPQVISTLQPDASAAASSLDKVITEHQLIFDAAVLGPVNTAVFRSDNGFVVASESQNIPGTDLILKEVTATTVTLAAGKDSKTLQLDKR